MPVNDFLGRPIESGAKIAYPVSRRGHERRLSMQTLNVQQVIDEPPMLCGLNDRGRRIKIKNLDCVVLLAPAPIGN